MTTVRGSLDVVSTLNAMGWAFSAESRKKVTVQALLNHAIVGEAIADHHRPDLAAVGMGDGNCGFKIEFYQEIDPLYLPFIVVKLEGSDVDLPRASMSGYNEYFSALYQKFPVSARHRSVFGGLWTDRIDAISLLKDRIDVAMIHAEAGETLSGFIKDGFMIVDAEAPLEAAAGAKRGDSAASPARRGKIPDLTEAVCGVLKAAPVLGMLKLILEGLPLALSTCVIEGSDEGFRQASAMEVLRSPGECVTIVVPLGHKPADLDVVRDSHLFPEFSARAESRWVNLASAVAIDVALREQGMVDHYIIPPGSAAIIGPGLIHRARTEAGTMALRVHCTPSRIAPLDRILDGSRKETILESGARVWM